MTRRAEAILAALHALDHPTAEEVHAEVRGTLGRIGLATIYRHLDKLVQDGTVRLREIGNTRRYDIHTAPHVHLHDTETGRLIDLPLTAKLQEALAELADEHLDRHDDLILELHGVIKK